MLSYGRLLQFQWGMPSCGFRREERVAGCASTLAFAFLLLIVHWLEETGVRLRQLAALRLLGYTYQIPQKGPRTQRPHTRLVILASLRKHSVWKQFQYNFGQPQAMHWLSTSTHPKRMRRDRPRHWSVTNCYGKFVGRRRSQS